MRLAVFDTVFSCHCSRLIWRYHLSGGYALAVIYLTIASLSGDPIMNEPVFFRLVVVLLAGPVVWLDWALVRGVSRLAMTYQSPAAATPGMSVEKSAYGPSFANTGTNQDRCSRCLLGESAYGPPSPVWWR